MKCYFIVLITLLFGCLGNTEIKKPIDSNCTRCELCDSLLDALLNQGFIIDTAIIDQNYIFSLTSDTSYKIPYNYDIYFLSKSNNNNYAFTCTEYISKEHLFKFITDSEVKATGIKPRLKIIRNNCQYEFSVTKESSTDELFKYDWLFDYVESY